MSDKKEISNNVYEVRKILSIPNPELDSYLEFCEKTITDKILGRCQIETIPERLNSLIQEFLIEQYNLNKDGIGEGKIQVSSASDNGQTVQFQTVGGASTMSKNAEQFLDRNLATWVVYRKMRW